MKYLSIIIALIVSFGIATHTHADQEKGSKGKGKQAAEQKMQEGKHRAKSKDIRHDEDHDEDHSENADENRKKAKAQQASGKIKGDEKRAANMNDRAREAQQRNNTSRQVKEDYKASVKSGETERVKGKKPWWKLWGEDSE